MCVACYAQRYNRVWIMGQVSQNYAVHMNFFSFFAERPKSGKTSFWLTN